MLEKELFFKISYSRRDVIKRTFYLPSYVQDIYSHKTEHPFSTDLPEFTVIAGLPWWLRW